MKFLNIGGATAILEHAGKRILFDPWLDEGIFHGSWFHFPVPKVSIKDIGKLDYIYISHIHEDHCSAGTLKHLDKNAEIIIMDKRPNFVAKFLDNHDFNFKKIHLVKPQTPVNILPNLRVDMLTGNPTDPMTYAIDSMLILKWDDFVIVNANDCQPYKEAMDYILSNYHHVDLALLPYSGGSGYPSCYLNLSDSEKLAECQRIRESRLENFVKNTNYLKPKYSLPFADQYVVGGSRIALNKFVSHPTGPGVVADYIKEREFNSDLLLLNSGQEYDFEEKKYIPDEPFHNYSKDEKETFLETLKDAKYDHEHFDLNPAVALDRIINIARENLWKMQTKKDFFPNFNLYLEAKDSARGFLINLASQDIKEVGIRNTCETPFLRISVSGTLLMLLLVGHVSWNIADAALFLDYERCPNEYDGKIYEYLNYLKV